RNHREQLFAEAVHRFKAGESWWEMPREATLAAQEDRYDEDSWTELIEGYLIAKDEITVTDILTQCLQIEAGKIQKSKQMRVATCLRRIDWEKGKNQKVGGRQIRFWRPKSPKAGNF